MYLNKAIVIGNLTRDPELRSLPSGAAVVTFGVATNRVWKDKEGNKKEDVQYHNIVVFGRQAETSGQYLKKGQSVLVEGRMQTRSWDATDGQKKYRTEIVADRVQFGPKAGSPGTTNSSYDTSVKNAPASPKEETPPLDYPDEEINPEDIPF